jgi:aspartate kinase
MQVYKFGGASVQDTQGIINLKKIIDQNKHLELVIVVSAMGKTTNMLELLTKAYYNQTAEIRTVFEAIKKYHYQIIEQLFEPDHVVFDDVENSFVEIEWILEDEPHDDYNFIYDQIVSMGELISTRIVAAFLSLSDIKNTWVDARSYIQTDNTYREGSVDWAKTEINIKLHFPELLKKGIIITQGFLGGTSENYTTTLGREGSDYSAAIFAYCMNAEAVTIWKDVPGVLNADPKLFNNTQKFDELSYAEAVEMTYYGATVIHPKTIKPLRNKQIPLYVKPFSTPEENGTVIKESSVQSNIPVTIVKWKQVLISISSKDFSFITEHHISKLFGIFASMHIKINMMQNSALSFTVCIDDNEQTFAPLMQLLNQFFDTKYNSDLELITIKHYRQSNLDKLTKERTVLLEQLSRNTAQLVLKSRFSNKSSER